MNRNLLEERIWQKSAQSDIGYAHPTISFFCNHRNKKLTEQHLFIPHPLIGKGLGLKKRIA